MAVANISRAGSSHDLWLPELWTPEVQLATKNKLVIAPLVDDRWNKPALKLGDTIRVPTVTNLTSRTKSVDTAITFETNAESTINITVNTHTYSAIRIEDIAELQTNVNLRAVYTNELAYPIALAIDDSLAALFTGFTTNTVGTAGVNMSDDDMLLAYQKLLEADTEVTPSMTNWVISPKEFAGLYKHDKFITAGKATEMFRDVKPGRGFVGVLYNAGVHVTNNLDASGSGTSATLMHKEAIALVVSRTPRMQTDYDIFHLSDVVVVDAFYGSKEMRDKYGVSILAS